MDSTGLWVRWTAKREKVPVKPFHLAPGDLASLSKGCYKFVCSECKPTKIMTSRGSHGRNKRRAKYVIYTVGAIAMAALMFYINFRRESNLQRVQERFALVQEQFEANPKFRNITTGIDKRMLVSTATGSVASKQDLKELNQMLSKTPPFPGTYNWRIEVEIRGGGNP